MKERESGTRTRIRNQYEYLRISFREVYSKDLLGDRPVLLLLMYFSLVVFFFVTFLVKLT